MMEMHIESKSGARVELGPKGPKGPKGPGSSYIRPNIRLQRTRAHLARGPL